MPSFSDSLTETAAQFFKKKVAVVLPGNRGQTIQSGLIQLP